MFRVVSTSWGRDFLRSDYFIPWPKQCPGCLHFRGDSNYVRSINRKMNARGRTGGLGCACSTDSQVFETLTREKEGLEKPTHMICESCGTHYAVGEGRAQIICTACSSDKILRPKYKTEGGKHG